MLIKVHKASRFVVAVCDSDLIGRSFEEDKRQLNLAGKFFLGEEKSEEESRRLLDFYRKEDACFNIVGRKSCEVAIKAGLIQKEEISAIQGIPFVLILA
jgi:hypothetical protein